VCLCACVCAVCADAVQKEQAVLNALCGRQVTVESMKLTQQWIEQQRTDDLQLIVMFRPSFSAVCAAVNTLPMPIAEEIIPHIITFQWDQGERQTKRRRK
jgi:hypothetical protein